MIERVVKNNLCLGCGLCSSLFDKKVNIGYSREGFIRPVQFQKLTIKEETLFKKICPGIYVDQQKSIDYHTVWGPIKNITAGFAVDETLRYKGSSGGALSAFLLYLLEEKIVDFVLHTGASSTHVLLNDTTSSVNQEDIIKKAGSRYSPSSPLKDIVSHLNGDKTFAFVGKPCDIVGIRNLIKDNPEHKNKVKALVSFMCAGIPSIKGTKEILKNLNIQESDVKSLRYRGEGWPGSFKVVDKEDNEHKITYGESWGTVLNRHLQFRCKICPDGTGEFADIVFADAWEESVNGYPSFEEKPGESLIISRTSLGESMLKNAITKRYIELSNKIINTSDLEKMQPYQAERKKAIMPRLLAVISIGRPIPRFNYWLLLKATQSLNIVKITKNFLGTLKRLI